MWALDPTILFLELYLTDSQVSATQAALFIIHKNSELSMCVQAIG